MAKAIPIVLGVAAIAVSGGAAAGLIEPLTAAYISVGLSVVGTLATALLTETPPKPQMQEGDVSIRQAIPPRVRLYGRQRMGGAFLYYDSTNDGDLLVLICHCAHEVAEYEEDWLNDERVQIDEDGNVTDDPWWQEEDDDSTVVIVHNLGSPDQSIGDLPDPPWTAAHRGRGLCATRVKYSDLKDEEQLKVFPSGPPPYRAVLKGAKIFDPRDPLQAPGVEDDYQWSDNAALVVLDHLTRTEIGIPVGFGIPFARIDLDSFSFAADVSDQEIPIKVEGVVSGVEKRWRIWGAFELTEDRKDVLKDLLDACAGRLIQGADGRIGLEVGAGKFRAEAADAWTIPAGVPQSSVTLDAAQLYEWDLTNGKPAIERINEVRATYVSEAWEWAETEAGIQTDEDGIARNGTESSQVKLRFVPSESQAQRVAREILRRGNPTWTGTVRVTLAGLDAWGERWITLQIPELQIDGLFELTGMRLDRTTMMVELDLASYDDWWDWTAATDEALPAVPPPVMDDDAEIPVPTGVAVTIVHRAVNGQTLQAVGVITWDPPPRSIYTARARYRPVTIPVSPWQSLPVAQDGLQVETNPLADGQGYEAQVRFIGSRGAGGDFSASVPFTAIADPVAPPSPTGLTAQQGVPTVGQVTVSVGAPNSPRHASLRFYRNGSNTFVGATLIDGPLYSGAGATRSYVDAPGIGDWWYFATSANWSNVESVPAGGVLAEVLPAAPAITSPADPITTNDNRLPIGGTGINGATVKLFANAVQVGSGTVAGGVWTVTPSTPYGNGVNSLTATQTVAGNESAASGSVAVTVNILDVDARVAIDAMIPRPTSARMGDLNTFVLALKAGGIWTKLDTVYLLAAHTSQAACLNIKAPGTFTLTPVNAPVFTGDRGFKGTAAGASAGGYLDPGFNPATAGGLLTLNNAHLAGWVRTAASTALSFTSAEIGNTSLRTFTKSATSGSGHTRSNNAVETAAAWGVTTGTGLFMSSRAASGTYERYHDNTAIAAAAVASSAILSTGLFILRSSAGTHSDAEASAASWGAALTAGEQGAYYTAVHDYLVAVGAA